MGELSKEHCYDFPDLYKGKVVLCHYLDPKASLGEILPEEKLTMMFRAPFRKNPLAHQPQGNPTSSGE